MHSTRSLGSKFSILQILAADFLSVKFLKGSRVTAFLRGYTEEAWLGKCMSIAQQKPLSTFVLICFPYSKFSRYFVRIWFLSLLVRMCLLPIDVDT